MRTEQPSHKDSRDLPSGRDLTSPVPRRAESAHPGRPGARRWSSLAISGPRPDVHVIAVSGPLDEVTSIRLTRLIEARARLRELGHATTRHIVLDLSGVTALERAGLAHLARARQAAETHRLRLHVVGLAAVSRDLSLRARGPIARLSTFPTLDAALHAL